MKDLSLSKIETFNIKKEGATVCSFFLCLFNPKLQLSTLPKDEADSQQQSGCFSQYRW